MYRALIVLLFFIFGNLNISKAAVDETPQPDVINFDSIRNNILTMPVSDARIDSIVKVLNTYHYIKESDIILSILRTDTPKFNNKDNILQLYFFEILAAKRDHNLQKANKYLDKIKPFCTTEEDYILYFNCLSIIVYETIFDKQFESAYDIIQKGKKLSQSINNKTIDYIITKCLIYLYNDTENFDKAKKLILESVNDPKLDPINKRELYDYLANVYIQNKEYKKALNSIDMSLKYSYDDNNTLNYSTIFQAAHIKKLSVMLYMNDLENAKKEIDIIDNKTDTAHIYRITRFNYIINLVKFNYMLKDYDKALDELKRLNTKKIYTTPYLTKQYYKASLLFIKGEKKEGATLFVKILEESLEFKTALIKSQREVSQANTRIQEMLYAKEQAEEHKMNTSIFFGITILLIFSFSIYRFIVVGKELKRTVDATQKAAFIARDNDTEKDLFLQNMTQDIEVPLSNVNKLTELIANNENVSYDKKKEYSREIKKSSKKLLHLITNILDLSRLESGMMKFTIDYFDLVLICKESINKAIFKNPNAKIEFVCSIDKLKVKGDVSRYNQLVYSLLTASTLVDSEINIKLTLLAIEKSLFSIIVEGSPLVLPLIDNKEQNIQNQINSLFVEIFNGSYYTERDKIIITMPVDCIPDNIIIEEDNTITT